MDASLKNWLIGSLRTPCGHESMGDMAKCNKCAGQFKRVERIYREKVKTNPELLKRETPKKPMSKEGAKMYEDMEFRLKHDPMYKWHLNKLARGTASEKKREGERWDSGYYKKHNDLQFGKWR